MTTATAATTTTPMALSIDANERMTKVHIRNRTSATKNYVIKSLRRRIHLSALNFGRAMIAMAAISWQAKIVNDEGIARLPSAQYTFVEN